MARLNWEQAPRTYENGLDRGVLYLDEGAFAWNGLTSIEEIDSGTVDTTHYFEGQRMHITQTTSNFQGVLRAFTYPDEFIEYDGYSEELPLRRFNLSYRTHHESGYRIHLIYNALARPTSRIWRTTSNQTDPSEFVWDIYTSSVDIPGASPASHLILDTREASDVTEALEAVLYGTETEAAFFPTPQELVDIYEAATTLRITYNYDGTWTAVGPDDVVIVNPDGSFEINAPTALTFENEKFSVRSY